MAIYRDLWIKEFTEDSIPEWMCPNCKKGVLTKKKGKFELVENNLSISYHEMEDWDANFRRGVFSGMIYCNKCGEVIAISGSFHGAIVGHYIEGLNEYCEGEADFLTPEYFTPSIEIFPITEHFPQKITDKIKESFKLFFSDASSCANKVRTVVELLMDHYKINKTKDIRGKRKKMQLHERIQLFGLKHKEAGKYLMAIKWLGNHGSHSTDTITKIDVLDAFEILEHTLNLLFNNETSRIDKITNQIIKRKGPRKKNR